MFKLFSYCLKVDGIGHALAFAYCNAKVAHIL